MGLFDGGLAFHFYNLYMHAHMLGKQTVFFQKHRKIILLIEKLICLDGKSFLLHKHNSLMEEQILMKQFNFPLQKLLFCSKTFVLIQISIFSQKDLNPL